MASVDTQWFRGVLADRKLSQRKLAQAMDLDPAALSLMLRGLRHVRLEEAQKMAEVLKVSVSDILAAFGVKALAPNGIPSVPLVGTVDTEMIITPASGDYVVRPPDLQGDAVALFNIASRWLYYVQSHEVSRVNDALNRYCMVQVKHAANARLSYIRQGLNGELMYQTDLRTVPVVAEIEHAAPVLLIKPL